MHVQDDLNLHSLCMLEGTFSLDVAQIMAEMQGVSLGSCSMAQTTQEYTIITPNIATL